MASSSEPKAHEPVLLEEVLTVLAPRPGQVVVDATLGSGGHARELLKRVGPKGRLIGIDQDPEALKRARENLKMFPQAEFILSNFSKLDEVLCGLNLSAVDAVLLDVGISTEQLEEAGRGFSFLREGPLDMRMDSSGPVTARDLIEGFSQAELQELFQTYGEERWAGRIARRIVQERARRPLETTSDLVEIIQRSVPGRSRFGPRHPAMRVFQALRIRVNGELEALKTVLPKAWAALRPGGRMAVISFHSLEDRIVKQTFRAWKAAGEAGILTPKPVRPLEAEARRNPRSRSARLRGVEKR